MAANKGSGSVVSSVIGFSIAVVLLAVGLNGINGNWYQPTRQFQSSASWERVPCRLTSIRLEETPRSKWKAESTAPIVEFRFAYLGKEYVSNRFWIGLADTADQKRAKELASNFEAEGNYECFVDPSEPTNAVLVRELNTSSAWVIRNYAIAAGIGLLMLLSHFASLFLKRSGTTVSEQNYLRAMANSTCPVESGDPDEPLIIQEAESRVSVALGLWIAGICWTGIVALIGSSVLQGKDWVPILFVSLFLVFGIGILVGAVYTTLQIFNPMPILACSQRDLYPGSEFELSWMFRGNVKKIQKLEIILEGIEKVSYRQGTSTRTEEKPFFRQRILESKSHEAMTQGFQIVTIPVATMHSFKSTNNSFTWQIRVNGAIPFWPDISDRFNIVVLAPLPVKV